MGAWLRMRGVQLWSEVYILSSWGEMSRSFWTFNGFFRLFFPQGGMILQRASLKTWVDKDLGSQLFTYIAFVF